MCRTVAAGVPSLGYEVRDRKLVVISSEDSGNRRRRTKLIGRRKPADHDKGVGGCVRDANGRLEESLHLLFDRPGKIEAISVGRLPWANPLIESQFEGGLPVLSTRVRELASACAQSLRPRCHDLRRRDTDAAEPDDLLV